MDKSKRLEMIIGLLQELENEMETTAVEDEFPKPESVEVVAPPDKIGEAGAVAEDIADELLDGKNSEEEEEETDEEE